jgi:hypothetical protein
MNLIAMEPHAELSSTGFVLANPGAEYLVLQPADVAEPFSLNLASGTYMIEWFSVNRRETKSDGPITVDSVGDSKFMTPFAEAGPSVLYLKRVESIG